MGTTLRDRPRHPALELLAGLVWTVGATGSYFGGATLGVVSGLGILAATFCLTLLIASAATGGRASTPLLVALLLQAPLVVGLSVYALYLPLGHAPFPCFFWEGTALQQLEAFAVVAALSAPLGSLLRMERGGALRLRAWARPAAPLATALAAVLAVLGAVRLSRLPTPDHYVESLPVHATIPSPRGQTCTPIEEKRDPKHDPGWRRQVCATPEVDASPVSFHFHGDAVSEGDARYYSLHYRSGDDDDHAVYFGVSRSAAVDLVVRRDAARNLFFVQRDDRLAVMSPDRWRWSVSLHEIRGAIAPPLSWWWATLAGLAFALACLGASAALGDVASAGDEARARWIARRRGQLSLAALAVVGCASAPLAAALACGFLT